MKVFAFWQANMKVVKVFATLNTCITISLLEAFKPILENLRRLLRNIDALSGSQFSISKICYS